MRYEFSVDRGGTFTDCVLVDRKTNLVRTTKVLSSDDAPLIAMRYLLGLDESEPLPLCSLRLGTTVATNALLERRGARTALLITNGFKDLLEIGDQTRPDLFQLNIRRSSPLPMLSLELPARLDFQGNVLQWPTDDELSQIASKLKSERIESVALVLLHSYAAPERESELAARLLRFWGGKPPHLVISSDATCEQGLLKRASTAVVDAYTAPLIKDYLSKLQEKLGEAPLLLMQSSGGLAGPARFRGPSAVLSGPAGGIIAGTRIAHKAKCSKVITFDMGGTSTDVALIEGEARLRFEKSIAGIQLAAPMLDIHTVAAGGGSVCNFNGYALTVGPGSVGADPGPICYGRTANSTSPPQLALTDINLILGRLTEDYFKFPLDRAGAEVTLQRLSREVDCENSGPEDVVSLARDFAAVATNNMAEAIRTVTIERGVELADADLLIFGGAAGQHACAIATLLGMRRIIVHRLSGVLSAYGIGQADIRWSGERDAGRVLLEESRLTAFAEIFRELETKGRDLLSAEALHSPLEVKQTLSLRYAGTESSLEIRFDTIKEMVKCFTLEHDERYGFTRPEASLEVVTSRLQLIASNEDITQSAHHRLDGSDASLKPLLRHELVHLAARSEAQTPVYDLSRLKEGHHIHGPALILDKNGTYLVEDDFEALIQDDLLLIEASDSPQNRELSSRLSEAARVQIVATRFSAIAEQMGEALRSSASSTNIRDRLDFSCAIFDAEGKLVANAPHIPVHLGAMGESVKFLLQRIERMRPGSSFVTNDPYLGGSHLPDITVVTPVFDSNDRLLAFTASRGHHADVGGISPGSMPAFSSSLSEEGVVFRALPLVEKGRFQEKEILDILTSGPLPAREPKQNLADLKAQLAANQLGVRLLLRMSDDKSSTSLASRMELVRLLSARWMGDAIEELSDGERHFSSKLDDGSIIAVLLKISGRHLEVDFTGSAPASAGNLNAPRAVTVACVLYALRTLLNRPLPLNQGCLAPITLTIPPDCILDPPEGHAVAGGNVETSQRIVDVLLAALGLSAASQGTMNNLSFGDNTFGYYETIAGGAGAGPDFDGASCVHTHMTNTRITDPEVLEARFPIRLWRFERRPNSGGAGRHRGGDGAIREMEALKDLQLSILSERRLNAPFGLRGGSSGERGANYVTNLEVPGHFTGTLHRGERLRIETPGGGGYGTDESKPD